MKKKKKKHKVALSLGSVWYAAARPPELRDTARTESRDFKSSQCPPSPAPETTGKRQMTPCSAWAAFQWRPLNHCADYLITKQMHTKRFILKIFFFFFLRNDWHESKMWKLFLSARQTRYRNFSLGISGEVFLSSSWVYIMEKKHEWKESKWHRNRKWN